MQQEQELCSSRVQPILGTLVGNRRNAAPSSESPSHTERHRSSWTERGGGSFRWSSSTSSASSTRFSWRPDLGESEWICSKLSQPVPFCFKVFQCRNGAFFPPKKETTFEESSTFYFESEIISFGFYRKTTPHHITIQILRFNSNQFNLVQPTWSVYCWSTI